MAPRIHLSLFVSSSYNVKVYGDLVYLIRLNETVADKMFQIKIVYFAVCVTLAVCIKDFDTYNGIKKSAVCLIQRIAQHHDVIAEYHIERFERKGNITDVACRLNLGKEVYNANSTSLLKANEVAARKAFAETRLKKYAIENITCDVYGPGKKSDADLLEEYADYLEEDITYNEDTQFTNGTYKYTASLNGTSASGYGCSRKFTKQEAAAQLMQTIGRLHVVDALTMQYNDSQYHDMEPMKRLRKIVRITDPTAEVVYINKDEKFETQEEKIKLTRIIALAMAIDYVASGEGNDFYEAKREAAATLLRNMDFTVTYDPKKTRWWQFWKWFW